MSPSASVFRRCCHRVQAGDDQALADLDEMIFGKKEPGAAAEAKQEKKDNLISF